jgi:hypothetical protein
MDGADQMIDIIDLEIVPESSGSVKPIGPEGASVPRHS